MKKVNLMNGCIVETRNGDRYIKINDCLLDYKTGKYWSLTSFDEDLTNNYADSQYDIMRVMNQSIGSLGYVNQKEEWDWERAENILTEKERDYLTFVLKPFKDDIQYIIKTHCTEDYLKIVMNDNDSMSFPYLKNNDMYKDMKKDTPYTLKELKLF